MTKRKDETVEEYKARCKEWRQKRYATNKDKILSHNRQYRSDNKEHIKELRRIHYLEHKHETYPKKMQDRRNQREVLVDSHGGKCAICGYKDNIAALDFHHIDPNTKEGKQILTLEEADKCILLCATCHREHHHGGMEYKNWHKGY